MSVISQTFLLVRIVQSTKFVYNCGYYPFTNSTDKNNNSDDNNNDKNSDSSEWEED